MTSRTSTIETRSKALYCLSSTLKHCEPAHKLFSSPDGLNGYSILSTTCLQDPSLKIRTKTSFLLAQLVSQSEQPLELSKLLREQGIIEVVLNSLKEETMVPTGEDGTGKTIDQDYQSKTLRFLVNLVERTQGKGLQQDEKERLRDDILKGLSNSDWNAQEELGMSSDEWSNFNKLLQ